MMTYSADNKARYSIALIIFGLTTLLSNSLHAQRQAVRTLAKPTVCSITDERGNRLNTVVLKRVQVVTIFVKGRNLQGVKHAGERFHLDRATRARMQQSPSVKDSLIVNIEDDEESGSVNEGWVERAEKILDSIFNATTYMMSTMNTLAQMIVNIKE